MPRTAWSDAVAAAEATAAAYDLPADSCRSAFYAAHASLAESVAQEADDQYPGVFYGPSDGAWDDAREAAFGVILPETDAPAAEVSDAAWEITESAWQVIRHPSPPQPGGLNQ